MEIKIHLFAALRDGAGACEIHLPWRQGMTSLDVLEALKIRFEPMANLIEHSFVAINGVYAESKSHLEFADEVAVLPPMSGG